MIAYNEVYNGIQTGVIAAAENEAAGIEQMKFYEVGPNVALTKHAITVRPLFISNKTFQKLPAKLRGCIMEAGREAGKYGRDIETGEDAANLKAMEEKGCLTTIACTDRDKMLALAIPVLQAYAEELGAAEVLAAIQAIK